MGLPLFLYPVFSVVGLERYLGFMTARLCGKVFKLAPFPDHTLNDGPRPINRILFANIMFPCELVCVPVQVLDTHTVVRTGERSFKYSPETLCPIRMSKMIDDRCFYHFPLL